MTPEKTLDIEELKLEAAENVVMGSDKEISGLKLTFKNEKGKEVSAISIYKATNGDYEIYHRKTALDYRGSGLSSFQLNKAEELIKKHLQRETAKIYLTTNQKSVIGWMKKNGYRFEDEEPDFSKEEIFLEQDGDTFYENRFKLVKDISSSNKVELTSGVVRESVSATLD
jgi:hypothetical protein